jgi:hypothetical protein
MIRSRDIRALARRQLVAEHSANTSSGIQGGDLYVKLSAIGDFSGPVLTVIFGTEQSHFSVLASMPWNLSIA